MKKSHIVTLAAVAVLFTAIGAYVGSRHTEPSAPVPSAKEITTSTLLSRSMQDARGDEQALSIWKEKPLVINFWAPWCAPCVEEMPELSALQAEVGPTGIQVIGIGIDSLANIAAFAAKYSIGYPLYVGGIEATELSRQFGNQAGGLPFTVLADANGNIKRTYLGRLKMDQLRKDLALLKPQTGP